MNTNYWLDGIMGVVVGDALGCPLQFMSRQKIKERGLVTGMEGYGTYNMPTGTWTDDSSMTIAALDSIRELRVLDPDDIMTRLVDWYEDGEYTPFGEAFDIGNTCSLAIESYERDHDISTCGRTSANSNGNGSLMRIMPACLYAYSRRLRDYDAVKAVHTVSGLTHNHLRSRIGCGLYYFCVASILAGEGTVTERLQRGMDWGFAYYESDDSNRMELSYYRRLRDLSEFSKLLEDEIKSTGYIVDSLEAAVWSVITTDNFKGALLKAVNLGDDADTVGAIAGGLAGLFYGYEGIPAEWLDVIQKRDWIEKMCRRCAAYRKGI